MDLKVLMQFCEELTTKYPVRDDYPQSSYKYLVHDMNWHVNKYAYKYDSTEQYLRDAKSLISDDEFRRAFRDLKLCFYSWLRRHPSLQ